MLNDNNKKENEIIKITENKEIKSIDKNKIIKDKIINNNFIKNKFNLSNMKFNKSNLNNLNDLLALNKLLFKNQKLPRLKLKLDK